MPNRLPASALPVTDEESTAAVVDWRGRLGKAVGPLVFAGLWWDPAGLLHALTPAQHHLSAVLALVIIFWVTEALPLALTALLGAVLCVLFGVASSREVFAPFADPLIFLFIGSFMLARAMQEVGLDRRFALFIMSRRALSGSPARLLLAIGLAAGLLSAFISNTAATAMLFPIVLGVVASLPEAPDTRAARARFACGALLMTAFAASVGGLSTPVGTPPNAIAIRFLREDAGLALGFVDWMKLALPLTGATALLLFGWLAWLYARGYPAGAFRPATEGLRAGPWGRGERVVLLAFVLTVALWVLPDLTAQVGAALAGERAPLVQWARRVSTAVPIAVPPLLGVLLLFVWPRDRQGRGIVAWPALLRIDWGTILLFGGGMALGQLLLDTGLAEAMGRGMQGLAGVNSLWGLTALAIAGGIVMSETTSNTSSANMMVPMMMVLAGTLGVSPIPPALGAALGASFGFMLPVSTPPNAIVYGTGRVPLVQMLRAGIGLDVMGFAVIWVGLRVLCPVLGLE